MLEYGILIFLIFLVGWKDFIVLIIREILVMYMVFLIWFLVLYGGKMKILIFFNRLLFFKIFKRFC